MKTETLHTPGSIADARDGYPAYKQNLARLSDRALYAEYVWTLKGTMDRIYGRNARAVFPFIVAEMSRRPGMNR